MFYWRKFGVQKKMHIAMQGTLILLFILYANWVLGRFEQQIISHAEQRAKETADGLINGMNMLMLTGAISHPANRILLLEKMRQSQGIKELRIVRGASVVAQYGPGLPEERAQDEMDRTALNTGLSAFKRIDGPGTSPMLRVVVPFIALKNFRGTNCLSCHHSAVGSVNGVASVNVDLSHDMDNLAEIKRGMWIGLVFVQILLSLFLYLLVNKLLNGNIFHPVRKLQQAMSEIQYNNDLSRRADVDELNPDLGEMARTFNALLASMERANGRLELFGLMFESSGEAILITNAEKHILAVNPAFERITQYSADELVGRDLKQLSLGKLSDKFYKHMRPAIETDGLWSGEISNRRKNGEFYPAWLSLGAVKDHKGKIINYIAQFSDITARKKAALRIERLAYYDLLTGLPNRALFTDRLTHALQLAERSGHMVGLMFLDLDHFKAINDTLGHFAGDQLLKSVAERLKTGVREVDTICRQGGDEFMVLLEEVSSVQDVASIALKILASMSAPHQLGDEERVISFSIGAAIYPDDASDAAMLTRCADQAMYRAKASGRNSFQFYQADSE